MNSPANRQKRRRARLRAGLVVLPPLAVSPSLGAALRDSGYPKIDIENPATWLAAIEDALAKLAGEE